MELLLLSNHVRKTNNAAFFVSRSTDISYRWASPLAAEYTPVRVGSRNSLTGHWAAK